MKAQVTLDQITYTFDQAPIGTVTIRNHEFGSLSVPKHHAETIFNALRTHDGHPMYRTVDVEGALCAWEWMLDGNLDFWFENVGTAAMRHCAMEAGLIAERTFSYMDSLGIEMPCLSYDWEFVPAVLRELDWDTLVRGNQYGGPPYQPDYADLLTKVLAHLNF